MPDIQDVKTAYVAKVSYDELPRCCDDTWRVPVLLMQYSSTFSFGQRIPHVASSCCRGRRCCNDKSCNFFRVSSSGGGETRPRVHGRTGSVCSRRLLLFPGIDVYVVLRLVHETPAVFLLHCVSLLCILRLFPVLLLPLCLCFHFPFSGNTMNFVRLTHFCLSCLSFFLFSLFLHFFTLSIFRRLLLPRSAAVVWHWRHRATGCEMSYIIQY